MSKKACVNCNLEYELSPEFWHKNEDSVDGYHSVCKNCRNMATVSQTLDDNVSALKQLQAEILKVIEANDYFTKLPTSNKISLERLVAGIRRRLGGEEGISILWVENYINATDSGRQKMLHGLMQMISKVQELGDGEKPAREKSTEEIEDQLKRTLGQMGVPTEAIPAIIEARNKGLDASAN